MKMVFKIFLVLISLTLQVNGYFTIVGSRTFIFGSNFELFITQNHESKLNSKLILELKGHKYGEEIEKTINLDFRENIVKFDVSCAKRSSRKCYHTLQFLFLIKILASKTSECRKFHSDCKN